MAGKVKIKINPKTGLPKHVSRNGAGYRFMIRVDGKRYGTITYKTPYEAAYKAHTSDWFLTCFDGRIG